MINKKLLWWIFGVSKGGPMRARIVHLLKDRPFNANQLAHELGVDYKTVRYHLDILVKNKAVTIMEEGSIVLYFISEELDFSEMEEICEKLGLSEKCGGSPKKH